MIDTTTRQRLEVSTDWGWGAEAYIVLPLTQLDQVKALLDANKISYWVDEEVLSIDGKPEIAWINLEDGTNPARVQSLLDSIP
jgi:hypothetical protein